MGAECRGGSCSTMANTLRVQGPVVSMGRNTSRRERTEIFLPVQAERSSPYGRTEERQLHKRPAVTWRNFIWKTWLSKEQNGQMLLQTSSSFPTDKREMTEVICCQMQDGQMGWRNVCRQGRLETHNNGENGHVLKKQHFLKGQLLKATHSMTWFCANVFHLRRSALLELQLCSTCLVSWHDAREIGPWGREPQTPAEWEATYTEIQEKNMELKLLVNQGAWSST